MPESWIVIPTYNERLTLPMLYARLRAVVPGWGVCVVDDASPDGTGAWVAAQHAVDPLLHLVSRSGPRGLGHAYRAGMGWVLDQPGVRWVYQLDADGSHPVDALIAWSARFRAVPGPQVIVGSRFVPYAWDSRPGSRRALSALAGRYLRWGFGWPIRDGTSGMKGWEASILRHVLAATEDGDGFAFQIATLYTAWVAGATIEEWPIGFIDRLHGQSKLTLRIVLEGLTMVPRLRRQARAGVSVVGEATNPLSPKRWG